MSLENWKSAAEVADRFSDSIAAHKPTLKTPPFMGFCLGKSHDGYIGLTLEDSMDTSSVIVKADIPSVSNHLIHIKKDGVSCCRDISDGTSVPFEHLLDENRGLKIC